VFNVYVMSLFLSANSYISFYYADIGDGDIKNFFNATQKYIVESIIVWLLFPKSWLSCMYVS